MRDWFTKDLGWKMFSVALALVIWATVHNVGGESATAGLLAVQNIYTNVPVFAVSAEADTSAAQITPAAVSITVSGAPNVIDALQPVNVHAVVNLTGIDSAHNLKRHVDVSLPPRITLLNVDPPDVAVTISGKK